MVLIKRRNTKSLGRPSGLVREEMSSCFKSSMSYLLSIRHVDDTSIVSLLSVTISTWYEAPSRVLPKWVVNNESTRLSHVVEASNMLIRFCST